MILISFTLALIAIVFGAKLLAQSQKESLAGLYKYLAWFIMVMGFLVLMCDGVHGLLHMRHRGDGRMMRNECMMMNRCDGMMGGCGMMMNGHRDNMCCEHNGDGMMNGGNCSDGMMNCPDGGGKASCDKQMNGGNCTMNMKCKMDSAKGKK